MNRRFFVRIAAAGGSKEAADVRNAFCPSMVQGSKRLDYVYCNKKMSRHLISAEVSKDAFTDAASDHHPILVVLK